MALIDFRIDARDGEARAGVLRTKRGEIPFPFFMPVGTVGAVKALTIDQLRALDPGIVLCNTYHLMLRPGVELIEAMGGLHRFMSWDGPILTDSGGYQVFSLGAIRKIREEGVEFRSHLDGSAHFLTPERSIEIQERLGVEIAMAFDECPAPDQPKAEIERSMEMTHRWAQRSLDAGRGVSAIFGIVQGGTHPDLRKRSVEAIAAMGFEGLAIGGLSVGEPKDVMHEVVSRTVPLLPDDKPRYLMGVGTPEDILAAVEAGVTMFDCVMPTRNARNGTLFTSRGKISIRNARYRADADPIDLDCGCLACRSVSRAYLRHLHVSGEIAASVYGTIHNLQFYLDLMGGIRQSIIEGRFRAFRETVMSEMSEQC